MNAAQRAQLLRERFKIRHPAAPAAGIGEGIARASGKTTEHPKRLRYVVLPKPTGRGFVSCGPMQWREGPAWVKAPDEHETPALKLKRRQGAPVLAKVGEKAKRVKLPRLKLREPWERVTLTP